MKKLSLDETWKKCLSMWRWIAKQIRKNPNLTVEALKDTWLETHTKDEPCCECYFCEYDWQQNREEQCVCCPANKVDPEFIEEWCMVPAWHFEDKPIIFYNKLVSLNRKRLVKKKRGEK